MKFSKAVLMISFFLASFQLYSQFTYVSGAFRYSRLSAGGAFSENSVSLSNLSLPVRISTRPVRFLEVGLELNPILFSRNKFSFKDDTRFSSSSYDGRYKADKFDYNFERTVKFGIFAKLFFESEVNSYIEFGISSQTYDETFVFSRSEKGASFYSSGNLQYSSIPATNINYTESIDLWVPSIAIGMKPHVSDRMFFDFRIGGELPSFDDKSFRYNIESSYDFSTDQNEFTAVEGQVTGRKFIFVIDLGFGIYF